jgi:hypothetical protein
MPPVDKQEDTLSAMTSIDSGDFFRLLEDVAGTLISKRASRAVVQAWLDALYEPIGGGGTGWQAVAETWTRTGNHSFTVATDLTSKYQRGTKVKYSDGGAAEYGVVGSSSYSAPNTTVTLITNSDYAMAAGSITSTFISYQEDPQDWPDWFNYTATWFGVAAPSFSLTRWKVTGNRTIRVFGWSGSGVSSTTNYSISAPITARTLTNAFWIAPLAYTDNSVVSATAGVATINSAGAFIVFFKDYTYTAGGWTNANNRAVRGFVLEYEF